jgi:SAM-dependent methyltransferase
MRDDREQRAGREAGRTERARARRAEAEPAARAARRAARAEPKAAAPARAEPASPKAAPNGCLGRKDVLAAYRWILGREPESEEVVRLHLAPGIDAPTLRQRFLASAEFRAAVPAASPGGLPPDAAPLPIELDAASDQVAEMLQRVRRIWARLGETAPHHSVLPEDRFRPDRIVETRAAFHATGAADAALLDGALVRAGIPRSRFGHLVEFGCGAGRVTPHLAAISPEVTAVDISAPHLEAARTEAKQRGLEHIRWLRARPEQPMPAEPCAIWFSRRVLQHNPPPVIRELLRQAFSRLLPGGAAVFQLLTYGFGYRFELAQALARPGPAEPALHVLPQAEVFALAAAAGLRVIEVQEDPVAGLDRRRWLSHLFVLRRPD